MFFRKDQARQQGKGERGPLPLNALHPQVFFLVLVFFWGPLLGLVR